jgi:hypothetical protein
MQRLVAAWGLVDAPFREAPTHSLREGGDIDAQPLCRDRPQASVEVGTDAIKIHAEYKATFACHIPVSLSL